jgi:hypothetical protein
VSKRRRLFQSDTFWGTLAVVLVLLQFWWLPGAASSSSDSHSTTIEGCLGVFGIMQELFPNVRRDAANVVPAQPATMLLIGPQRYPSEAEQQRLLEFVMNGGQLIFAPRWHDPAFESPLLGIYCEPRVGYGLQNEFINATAAAPAAPPGAGTSPTGDSTTGTNAAPGGSPGTPAAPPAPPARVNVDPKSAPGAEVIAQGELTDQPVMFHATAELDLIRNSFESEALLRTSDGSVEMASHWLGYGRVVVCSSPDLFSNRSMLKPELRRLAVRVVEHCRLAAVQYGRTADPIVFNEYFNASSAFQQTGILFSPLLRNGSLQLLLVAVLGIWLAFQRFGPAEDVTTVQRRSLSESAQAVGNLQYRVRDGGTVVARYLDFISSQMRRRFGGAVRLDDPRSIASRTGLHQTEVATELDAARRLASEPGVSPVRAAQTLRWLARLNERLAGHVTRSSQR